MKKIFLTSALFLSLTATSFAGGPGQEADTKARDKARQQETFLKATLSSSYLEPADGQWTITKETDTFQQAAYLASGKRISLFFSKDGEKMFASAQIMDIEALPKKQKRKLARKCKGYAVEQVVKYFDGQTIYFVTLKNSKEEMIVNVAAL